MKNVIGLQSNEIVWVWPSGKNLARDGKKCAFANGNAAERIYEKIF